MLNMEDRSCLAAELRTLEAVAFCECNGLSSDNNEGIDSDFQVAEYPAMRGSVNVKTLRGDFFGLLLLSNAAFTCYIESKISLLIFDLLYTKTQLQSNKILPGHEQLQQKRIGSDRCMICSETAVKCGLRHFAPYLK
jgi:hypothetical protein